MYPARWWHRLDDGRIQCDLCPRDCRLHDAIALANGLHYVYTGNVHDVEGGTTYCPGCGEPLIRRDWYEVLACELDVRASCPHCGARVAGCFGAISRGFGRRPIPVRLEAAGGEP